MIHYQVMPSGRLRSKMNKEGLERFFTCGYTDDKSEALNMMQLVSAINSGAVHILDHDACDLGEFYWASIESIDNEYAYVVDMSFFKEEED